MIASKNEITFTLSTVPDEARFQLFTSYTMLRSIKNTFQNVPMPRALVRYQALPDVARIVPTPGRYRTAALLLIACKTENAIEKGSHLIL